VDTTTGELDRATGEVDTTTVDVDRVTGEVAPFTGEVDTRPLPAAVLPVNVTVMDGIIKMKVYLAKQKAYYIYIAADS
jgi:hypothetical protein